MLAAAAVVAAVLAVHGWASRHSGLAPGTLAGPARSGPSRTGAARPGPSVSTRPSAGPGSTSASPSAGLGPTLSNEPYAAYSYLIWPGNPDAAARTAMAGLAVTVRRQGASLSVAVGVNGHPAATVGLYHGGTRVYVVEASLGDDSGATDYNLGDDGLVVTDAQGRIVR